MTQGTRHFHGGSEQWSTMREHLSISSKVYAHSLDDISGYYYILPLYFWLLHFYLQPGSLVFSVCAYVCVCVYMCVCVCVCVCVLSCVPSFVTLWTVACHTPLSVGFPRQEVWSELSLPIPGDLPNLGIEPVSLLSPALAGRFFTTMTPEKPLFTLDGPQLLISFQIALLRCVVRISNMIHGAASLQDGLKDLSSCPSHLAL